MPSNPRPSRSHLLVAACVITALAPLIFQPGCAGGAQPILVGLRDMNGQDGDLTRGDGGVGDGGLEGDLGGDMARPWTDKSIATGGSLWAVWNSGAGTVLISGDGAAVYKSVSGAAFAADTSAKPVATPTLLSINSVTPGPPSSPMYVAGQVGTIWAYSGNLTAGTGTFAPEATGTTQPLYGVWVASDGVAFAVGQEIALKRTTSWAPVTGGPATAQAAFSIWGAKTASAYTVYAVGAAGKIWHSNGGNFIEETSGTTNALYGVWGSGPSDIYAVGDVGTILHSTGTGTWTQQNSGTALPLEGIGGANASEIYIVGDKGTVLHKTDPASAIWDPEALPNAAEMRDFFAVSATASEVVVVGKSGAVLRR